MLLGLVEARSKAILFLLTTTSMLRLVVLASTKHQHGMFHCRLRATRDAAPAYLWILTPPPFNFAQPRFKSLTFPCAPTHASRDAEGRTLRHYCGTDNLLQLSIDTDSELPYTICTETVCSPPLSCTVPDKLGASVSPSTTIVPLMGGRRVPLVPSGVDIVAFHPLSVDTHFTPNHPSGVS